MDGPPIENGLVRVQASQLVEVEPKRPFSEREGIEDLGEVAIVPGFLNAHTHLEFSHFEQPITPALPFTDWIGSVVRSRRGTETSPQTSLKKGFRESHLAGTVALAEIATEGWTFDSFNDPCYQGIVFREVLGFQSDRIEPGLETAETFLKSTFCNSRLRQGLSPHAPYSVHPQLFEGLMELAVRYRVPVAMHLAETKEELEFLRFGTGPFREVLERLGVWEETSFFHGKKPLDYLERLFQAVQSLVVHGNYLSPEELTFLGERRDRMAVVFCPRTHCYFEHSPYLLKAMLEKKVKVLLGTDSRASNPNLSLYEEAQLIYQSTREAEWLSAADLLNKITLEAAQVLGFQEHLGSLTPGKEASFVVIQPGGNPQEPIEAQLLAEDARIKKVMLQGKWVS
ncbi:Aminodeoxyfutalosine deaminase [Planctomycetales bacterium 10988]|nr:Aminodeoxyfutalosine deaminase [Planctomycetales bacterium 10988]